MTSPTRTTAETVVLPAPLSMQGMDILVLSPTPTHPQDQGNRKRIHAVCRSLQLRGARVHFVYYPQEWWFEFLPHDLVDQMRATWDSFHLVPSSRHTYLPPKGQDYHIDEWWDDSVGTTLQWLFKRQRFDAFIVNYAYMSKAFEYAPPQVLRILDTHDLFTGRRELLEQHGLKPEFFYTTRDQEQIALQRADWIWAIKDQEAEVYRSLSSTPVMTMPHAEPAAPARRWRREEDEGRLVVGMLGSANLINIQNARDFVERALPRFQGQGIDIRFMGGMCQRMSDLYGQEGLDLAGPVADVQHFYRDVDVVIVPLAFSTGLKIKAVEAFAAGVPVVAVGHALEGIPVQHPWHQCADIDDVVSVCLELAADPTELETLRQASAEVQARMAAQAHLAFDALAQRLSHRPVAIVTLDQAFFDMDSLYREQVFQTINLLQQQAPVLLYLDQPLPEHQPSLFEAFNGLNTHCKLVIPPYLEQHGGRSLGLSHSKASLAELLQRHAKPLLWVARLAPELADLSSAQLRMPVFLRLDLMRLLGTEPSAQALADLSARCAELNLVDNHPRAPLPSVSDKVRHLLVPFWRWKPSRLPAGAEGQTLHILAHPQQLALADTLLDALLSAQPERAGSCVICSSVPDVPTGPWPHRQLSLRQAQSQLQWLRPLPEAVLDLSGDAPLFEVLRETYRRAGVPVVQASGRWDEAAVFRLGELVDLLFNLSQHLPQWQADLGKDVRVRYGNDAGWSSVWRALTVRQALA